MQNGRVFLYLEGREHFLRVMRLLHRLVVRHVLLDLLHHARAGVLQFGVQSGGHGDPGESVVVDKVGPEVGDGPGLAARVAAEVRRHQVVQDGVA